MRKLLAAMFAGIALYSAASSFRLAQQDFLYTSVATEVSFWGRGDYEPTAFTTELAVRGVERLIQQAPANSKYLSLQAKLYSWQGYWAQDTSTKSEFGQMAVASQYSALGHRPAYLQSWKNLSEYVGRTRHNPSMAAQVASRMNTLTRTAGGR